VLNLEINGWPAQSFICTPSGLQELALGWAFSQELIEEIGDVQRITPYPDRVSLMIAARRGPTSPNGNGVYRKLTLLDATMASSDADPADPQATDEFTCTKAELARIIEQIYPRLHIDDAGDHDWYAAITDGREVCVISGDLDPINIVDKLIGWSIARNVDRSGLILCVSSKITAELVTRVCRAKIPMLISHSVPSDDAIDLAEAHRLTLVGRARHKHPTIYTHAWRIADLEQ
jgi:FdhD protein